jgi:hypothetical protein
MLCLLYRCPPPFPVLICEKKKKKKQAKLNYPSLMFVDMGGYVLICLGKILQIFFIRFGFKCKKKLYYMCCNFLNGPYLI